jgi:hypothetical protein
MDEMLLHCLPIATTRHLNWFISPQSAGVTRIQGSIYVFHVSFSRGIPYRLVIPLVLTTISMAKHWAAR